MDRLIDPHRTMSAKRRGNLLFVIGATVFLLLLQINYTGTRSHRELEKLQHQLSLLPRNEWHSEQKQRKEHVKYDDAKEGIVTKEPDRPEADSQRMPIPKDDPHKPFFIFHVGPPKVCESFCLVFTFLLLVARLLVAH